MPTFKSKLPPLLSFACHGEDFDSLKASDEPSDPYVHMIIDAFGQVDGDPMHEDIRNEFDKKAGDRLRGTLNQVFKMALHKQVSFITDTVRAEFINKRKHPDFVKRSNQARDNRLSGQTLEKFDPGHRQGSISTPQVVKKMAKKKDGILPTAAEVYESTHSVCVGSDEVELMGDKSQKVMGEYMEKLEEYKNKGIEINPDKVYLEVVGGQKKGKVYGLGSASHMYYKSDPTS